MRMPHWPHVPWNPNAKYDLNNIRNILKELGSPDKSTPPIIHVAGTNGKGSTVAMLRSIFEAANYKVHTYTSPHLINFNERIVLASEMISDAYLFEICERTRQVCAELEIEPRFFEAITAASFIGFAEIKADILIIETGLGGRLDATNIVEPIITLITPISYDHMEYLGHTLTSIANEKAGIIKAAIPCVITEQYEEVYEVLLDKCNELSCPAFCFNQDFTISKQDNHKFKYFTHTLEETFSAPSLLGDHQLINASGVIAAITLLNNQFKITKQQMQQGLSNVYWPARIEKIPETKYQHLIQNAQIWLDGAHNFHGAQVLSNWIRTNFTEPVYMIIGMTKNRNIESFCQNFTKLLKTGYTVKVLSEPSSYNARELAIRASTIDNVFLEAKHIEDALLLIDQERSRENSSKKINVVICGSLFLAADLMKLLIN